MGHLASHGLDVDYPLGFAGGDVDLYAYVSNSPLFWSNPLGLKLDRTEAGGLLPALERVRGTTRGAEMFNKLEKSPHTFKVKEGRGGESSRYDPGTKSIIVNPTKIEPICTTAGRKPASTERKLAHEAGHALGWPGGDPQIEMLNIRLNENPVAKELGQPERTKYLCP